MEKDVNMGTGYCTHRLYIDCGNRIIIVPEKYSVSAEKVVNNLDENRFSRKEKDVVYLHECIRMSHKDFNRKKGLEKDNALSNWKFFEKILESIVK